MLYSPEYQHQQEMMHKMPRGYGGVHSRTYAPPILDEIDRFKPEAVLDYGAGKGHFGEMLFKAGYRGEYRPYDPGIPYWSSPPDPAPYVICIDVLEHIEPDLLDNVLCDIQRVLIKNGVITVHHRPAKKTLPDGRNAHLTVEPPDWWTQKLGDYFKVVQYQGTVGKYDGELLSTIYIVEPLP